MKTLGHLAHLVLVGCACLFLWRASLLMEGLDKSQQGIANHAEVVLAHLDEAAKQSADVSRDTRINLVHFDRNQQRIARELDGLIATLNKEAVRTSGTMNAAIARTDDSLNSDKYGLIPVSTLSVTSVALAIDKTAEQTIPVIQHTDDLVNSAALKGTLSSTDSAMKHVNNVADALDKVTHPPKASRKQRILQFLLQTIFGNAVQGAVRR